MKKMKLSAMELIAAGDKNCDYVTGFMCGATAILAFSAIFAPLAGATGVGCAIGLATGCGPKKSS